jgi:hypothetical protein
MGIGAGGTWQQSAACQEQPVASGLGLLKCFYSNFTAGSNWAVMKFLITAHFHCQSPEPVVKMG